jgi:hypothetical protein
MITSITITRDDIDIPVDVDFTFYPAYRGRRDSIGGVRNAGPPLEPDEPASIEINSVKDFEGYEYELTDSEIEEIAEGYYGMRDPALEDWYESRFDR